MVMAFVLLGCAGIALVLYSLGIFSTYRHVNSSLPKFEGALPPLSLLKPIKGTEEALEDNLRSFFTQDYPADFEIIFSSTEANDAGIDVAKRVAKDYPHVSVSFIRSDPQFGLNPKVANLAGAIQAASHDLVLQSDANVRVHRSYMQDIVRELLGQDASLLTSMVVGSGEKSWTAGMENLQLSALIAPATCTALHVAGVTCVIGKSMLFRQSELSELGGIELVRDILCEDFILGQHYANAGKKIILSPTTVHNINEHTSLRQYLSRHSRWLKMRTVIHIGSFMADLFVNPTFFSLMAVIASGFDPRFVGVFVSVIFYKLCGDAYLIRKTRKEPLALKYLLLGPFKDVLMGFVWGYSCFSRSVEWRGVRLRFGAQSRLRPDDGTLPVRMMRRLFGTS